MGIKVEIDNVNTIYGNPLKLKVGEVTEVEMTPDIKILLNAGALKITNVVVIPTPIVIPKPIEVVKPPVITKPIEPIKPVIIPIIKKKEVIRFNIRGIGGKTLDDINKIYDNEEELIFALTKDKVPLRDDVVMKLKKYYKV